MSAFSAVFRRELGAALDGLWAPIVAACLGIALAAAYFFVGFPFGDPKVPALWAGGVASLSAAFGWLPLLWVLLCPALCMGAWADERSRGTEDLLLSYPASAAGLVLGKFAASAVLLGLMGLGALWPLIALVAWLGPLDLGVALAGVLGAIGLALVCAAWCHLLSALCKDALLAFLLGALLLGALWVLALIQPNLPAALTPWIWILSPSEHYTPTLARGLFEWRDAVWALVALALPLFLTGLVVEARRWR